MEPGRAGGDGHGVGSADPFGDELFEPVDRRPEREPARPEHLEDELLLPFPEVRPRERDRLHLLSHACSVALAWLEASPAELATPGSETAPLAVGLGGAY